MTRIGIVTDTTNCLPPELIKQYAITVVPLGCVFRSKSAGSSEQIGHPHLERRRTIQWHRITLEVIHAQQEIVRAQDQRDSTFKIRLLR